MSDLKRTCPACDSWSSSVGIGFRDQGECPFCGLPAEAVEAIDVARERGASAAMLERAAKAEARAARAEREAARLRGLLVQIGRLAQEDAGCERGTA